MSLNGNLTATGTIAITDADQNQASFQTTVTAAQGNLGSLTLQANGSYTYTVADSAVQFLGANDIKVDTFTVTALDGTTKQISFTIHGANDAAVIGDPTVHDVTEDLDVVNGNLTASGTIAITDADQNQASFQTTVTAAQGNLGSLTLQANGSYTYTVADSAVQFLGANDIKVDTFTVTALDGTTKQISFTIHGANDAAVIGDPTVHDVTEDLNVVNGNLTASGTIAITDADQNQASFQTTVTSAQGNLGSLTLQANGSYTYTVADSAVQFLGANDTKVDTFTVTALDGTTKQISFTIHGANDAAVIGDPTVHDVTEDLNVAQRQPDRDRHDRDHGRGSEPGLVPDHRDERAGQSRQPDAAGQRQLHLRRRRQRGSVPRRQRHQGRHLHGDGARRHHQADQLHHPRRQRRGGDRRSDRSRRDRGPRCRQRQPDRERHDRDHGRGSEPGLVPDHRDGRAGQSRQPDAASQPQPHLHRRPQ